MQCSRCGQKAVFDSPALCAGHFLEHVEQTVQSTIKQYSLCSKADRVCVAASGGKDSAALLFILKRSGYRVEVLAVDEGIAGYRDRTLEDLRKLCGDLQVPLRVVSFRDEVGGSLDVLAKGRHPCSVCGVFRRYLLNKYAEGFDVIATGHNLDDEAQSVLMNVIKANHTMFFRSHVRTPPAEGFIPRVKPLMFLTERQVLAYTVLRGLRIRYGECPHVPLALRARVRDVLNEYEGSDPGMKRRLVEAALHVAVQRPASLVRCGVCGQPSAHQVCRACVLKGELAGGAS